MLALFAILLATNFILGPTPYASAAGAAVLVIFLVFLWTSLRSGTLKLRRIAFEKADARSEAMGPIAQKVSILSLAMGGDASARAEVARLLKEATEAPTQADSVVHGIEGGASSTAPASKREKKATRASRETYLKSVEEALLQASQEVGSRGE